MTKFGPKKARGNSWKICRRAASASRRRLRAPREHVTRALERNGLLLFFEKIFTTSEMGTSKHEPDIYNAAAAFMGTQPSETAVFEDSLYALKTAKAAGYAAFGVFDMLGEPDQDGMRRTADVYVERLSDATTLLSSRGTS